MKRPDHVLDDNHDLAAVELGIGAVVLSRPGTADEAWAWAEYVPRCGRVFIVKGPRPTDDDEGDPRAHDTADKAIADLASRRAPAPKPDELTVDDVLAFVAGAVENADDYHPLGFRPGGDDITRLWQLRAEAEGFTLTNMMSGEELVSSTMRGLMTQAKRRGLLG